MDSNGFCDCEHPLPKEIIKTTSSTLLWHEPENGPLDELLKDRSQIVFSRESKRLTNLRAGLFLLQRVPDSKIAEKRKMGYNEIKKGELKQQTEQYIS